MKHIKPIVIAIICGLLSFIIDTFLIPKSGIPDLIWITACIVLPCVVAIILFEIKNQIAPVYLFVGLIGQYIMLTVFADTVSKLWGIQIHGGGFGDLQYIYEAIIWPLGITLAQFISIICFRKLKNINKEL